jgi:hypothetical protein
MWSIRTGPIRRSRTPANHLGQPALRERHISTSSLHAKCRSGSRDGNMNPAAVATLLIVISACAFCNGHR